MRSIASLMSSRYLLPLLTSRSSDMLQQVEMVTTETVKSNDGDVVAGWSTGIAEVALPQTFKLKNIAQTEAAARRIQEQEQIQEIMRRNANSNMSFSRFHVQDHEQREMSSALVPAEDQQDSKGRRREEKATDLKVFQGYKKVLLVSLFMLTLPHQPLPAAPTSDEAVGVFRNLQHCDSVKAAVRMRQHVI